MSGTTYPQGWCGQSQPHEAHVWAQAPQGWYTSCAGHTGAAVVAPGACWAEPPAISGGRSSYRCELLAGHAGAHECDRGSLGGKAAWTDPQPARDDEDGDRG